MPKWKLLNSFGRSPYNDVCGFSYNKCNRENVGAFMNDFSCARARGFDILEQEKDRKEGK
jgi:hypothetical protein